MMCLLISATCKMCVRGLIIFSKCQVPLYKLCECVCVWRREQGITFGINFTWSFRELDETTCK